MPQLQLCPISLPDPDPFSLLQVVTLHVSYQVRLVLENYTTDITSALKQELLLATIMIIELPLLPLVILVFKHVPHQFTMQ